MKEVVFISEIPRGREAKMAAAAKLAGYSVSLIYQHQPNYPLGGLFDRYVQAPWNHVADVAHMYSPRVFHIFSPTVAAADVMVMNKRPGPVIFEFADLIEGMFKSSQPESQRAQKYCIENADAVVERDLQLDFARDTLGYKVPRSLHIPDMCWDSPSQVVKLEGMHVVLAGNFGLEQKGEGDWGYLEIARALVRDGVAFHIYPHYSWYNAPEEKVREAFGDFINIAGVYVYKSVGSDKLQEELCQYTFGANLIWGMMSGGMKSHSPDHVRTCGSSRNTDYLDAGLPVLLSPELEFQRKTLGAAAVPVGKDFLDHPREFLESVRADVCEARERLAVRNYAERLGAFYDSF